MLFKATPKSEMLFKLIPNDIEQKTTEDIENILSQLVNKVQVEDNPKPNHPHPNKDIIPNKL